MFFRHVEIKTSIDSLKKRKKKKEKRPFHTRFKRIFHESFRRSLKILENVLKFLLKGIGRDDNVR